MGNTLLASDALEVLRQIESGLLTMTWAPTYDDTVTSPTQENNPIFAVSNGWRICVSKNNGVWDHIEGIETNDGRLWKATDAADSTIQDATLAIYQPPAVTRQGAWTWAT